MKIFTEIVPAMFCDLGEFPEVSGAGGPLDLIYCTKWWLSRRPRRVRCWTCKRRMWMNGEPADVPYCSKECYDADYFPRDEPRDELPF